jgi:hypothetical protein
VFHNCRSGDRKRSLRDFLFPVLPDGVSKLMLDAPRQLILPFGADAGIRARHLEIAVAGDLWARSALGLLDEHHCRVRGHIPFADAPVSLHVQRPPFMDFDVPPRLQSRREIA